MSEIIPEKQKVEPKIKYCRCCGKVKKIICKTCGKKKKLEEFHIGKNICKDCRSKYNREKYQSKKALKVKKNEMEVLIPISYHLIPEENSGQEKIQIEDVSKLEHGFQVDYETV